MNCQIKSVLIFSIVACSFLASGVLAASNTKTPIITGAYDPSGTVIINGSNFDAVGNMVDFIDNMTGNTVLEVTAPSTNGGTLVAVSFGNLPVGQYVIDVTTKAGIITQAPSVFIFPEPPTISSISPSSAPDGTSITITGSGFSASNNSVSFTDDSTGMVASILSVASTNAGKNIIFSSPNLSVGADYDITVTPSGGSPTTYNTVFSVPVVPTISSFSPTSGAPGSNISIKGSNFDTAYNTVVFTDNSSGYAVADVLGTSSDGKTIVFPVPDVDAGQYNVSVVGVSGFASNIPTSLFTVIASPVSGVCGSANGVAVTSAPITGLCTTGTASAVSGAGPWNWTCAGSNSGTNVSCSAPKKTNAINGVCGSANGVATANAPSANLCSVGTSSSVLLSGSNWAWTCAGSNGGTTISCSAPKIPPVNGVCGPTNGVAVASAPITGLCTTGTASAVSGSGPWNWTCAGSNGGTTKSCSASKIPPVNGVCGAANGVGTVNAPSTNLCTAGTASIVSKNGAGNWIWTCAGIYGGTTASCSAVKLLPVSGVCGSANGIATVNAPTVNLCSVGAASPVTATSPYTWTCLGINGGPAASCSAPRKSTIIVR